MEERFHLARFFFQDPTKGYSQLARLIRDRFRELFEDNTKGGQDSHRESTFKTIVKSAEVRFLMSVRIQSEYGINPNKLNLYEYYLLLEQIDKSLDRGRNSRN